TPYRMHSNINSPYWEPSCSVTPDEKTLYFSSNRPGGFGGRDIYVTQKIAGDEWTEPMNLGPEINTAYDEDAPFIHPDGKTLFFSSRGHQSMGGFDLFKSVLDFKTKKWSNPENLGYPINTADDDVFYVWSPDGSKAYFSSIREEGFGDKDIYVLKRPDVHNFIIVVRGKVLDKETGKAVAATITFSDLATNEMVGVFTSNSFNGKFTSLANPGKNYAVTVEAPGYLFHSENVNVPDVNSYLEIVKEIYLEPLKEGSKVTLNNVFFDYGKSNLKEESSQELEKLVKILQTNPNLFVEFSGHTDSIGSDAYNKKLSDDRAEVVLKYMVHKGIAPSRMLAVGYGEEFPIAPNSDEVGRKQNRRTEMIIVEALDSTKLKPTLVLKKDQGYYYRRKKEEDERLAKIRAEEQRQLALLKKREEEEALIAKSKRQDIDLKTKVKEIDISKLEISNLYFDVNKAELKDTSKLILDTLAKIMKLYPKLKIVLSGHTDSTYTEQYNLKLSQKRVDVTYEFLLKKGISPKKIRKEAFGESLPKYTNETKEGRKLNRRVEIDFILPKESIPEKSKNSK
ncbi:MAG: OmpA family protein, partial [Cytophagales bacterium]